MNKIQCLEPFKEGVKCAVKESNQDVQNCGHIIETHMIENQFELSWRRGQQKNLLRFDNTPVKPKEIKQWAFISTKNYIYNKYLSANKITHYRNSLEKVIREGWGEGPVDPETEELKYVEGVKDYIFTDDPDPERIKDKGTLPTRFVSVEKQSFIEKCVQIMWQKGQEQGREIDKPFTYAVRVVVTQYKQYWSHKGRSQDVLENPALTVQSKYLHDGTYENDASGDIDFDNIKASHVEELPEDSNTFSPDPEARSLKVHKEVYESTRKGNKEKTQKVRTKRSKSIGSKERQRSKQERKLVGPERFRWLKEDSILTPEEQELGRFLSNRYDERLGSKMSTPHPIYEALRRSRLDDRKIINDRLLKALDMTLQMLGFKEIDNYTEVFPIIAGLFQGQNIYFPVEPSISYPEQGLLFENCIRKLNPKQKERLLSSACIIQPTKEKSERLGDKKQREIEVLIHNSLSKATSTKIKEGGVKIADHFFSTNENGNSRKIRHRDAVNAFNNELGHKRKQAQNIPGMSLSRADRDGLIFAKLRSRVTSLKQALKQRDVHLEHTDEARSLYKVGEELWDREVLKYSQQKSEVLKIHKRKRYEARELTKGMLRHGDDGVIESKDYIKQLERKKRRVEVTLELAKKEIEKARAEKYEYPESKLLNHEVQERLNVETDMILLDESINQTMEDIKDKEEHVQLRLIEENMYDLAQIYWHINTLRKHSVESWERDLREKQHQFIALKFFRLAKETARLKGEKEPTEKMLDMRLGQLVRSLDLKEQQEMQPSPVPDITKEEEKRILYEEHYALDIQVQSIYAQQESIQKSLKILNN